MNEIGQAMGAVSAAWELARVAVEARDDAKVRAAMSDMGARLVAANAAALAFSEQVRTLSARLHEVEAELRQARERAAERNDYVLDEVKRGVFAYLFKPHDEVTKLLGIPAHYLCQNCFDAGKKSVLRNVETNTGRALVCAESRSHDLLLG